MRLEIAIAVLTLVAAAAMIDRQTFVAEAQQATPALTGDVIVKFKDGTTLAGVGAAIEQADAAPVQSTPSGAVLLEPDAGQTVDEALASLNADPNVAYAEPDVLVTIDVTPNDTYYGGYQAWHFDQINAPAAWDSETGAPGTVIAVIDTGVQSVHPDLNGNMVSGANFVTVPVASSSNSGGQVRVTTNTPHPYLTGEQVTISGHSVAGVNGTWTISMPAALTISSSTLSAGTITVTTTAAHNLLVGDYAMVRGHSIGGANGQWTVTAVPSATQFRYSCSPACTTGSGTGGVAKQATWFNLSGSTYSSAGTSGNALNTSPRDDEGHGTSVAGFIAAESNNSQGVAGVCWTCKIMPVKVLGATGSGSSLAVAAGIEWAADNDADVINLSLSSPSHSQAMLDAVDYAWGLGAIVVAASGNDGDTLDPSVRYPAKYPNAIAVGATNASGLRASFSNYGPELDIVAPGENVTSTSATGFGDSGGWYASGSGTSFAAPHVAGVV
ncbi:MAG: S8 family serine peptidase, partial [Dehalococcoidia bacterium]